VRAGKGEKDRVMKGRERKELERREPSHAWALLTKP